MVCKYNDSTRLVCGSCDRSDRFGRRSFLHLFGGGAGSGGNVLKAVLVAQGWWGHSLESAQRTVDDAVLAASGESMAVEHGLSTGKLWSLRPHPAGAEKARRR